MVSAGLSLDRAIQGIQRGIESARLTASQVAREDPAKPPEEEAEKVEQQEQSNAAAATTGSQPTLGARINVIA